MVHVVWDVVVNVGCTCSTWMTRLQEVRMPHTLSPSPPRGGVTLWYTLWCVVVHVVNFQIANLCETQNTTLPRRAKSGFEFLRVLARK